MQRLGQRVRFGGGAGDGESEGTCEGTEVAEAVVRRGPFRSKGAPNFGGGERDLRRLAVPEDGLRKGGADDKSRKEKKRGDSKPVSRRTWRHCSSDATGPCGARLS